MKGESPESSFHSGVGYRYSGTYSDILSFACVHYLHERVIGGLVRMGAIGDVSTGGPSSHVQMWPPALRQRAAE